MEEIMKSVEVKLDSIEKVKKFVNFISSQDGEFDLTSGRYVVDAKSIMGILSLDLTKSLRLDIYDKECDSTKLVQTLETILG